mgnify:FL=1
MAGWTDAVGQDMLAALDAAAAEDVAGGQGSAASGSAGGAPNMAAVAAHAAKDTLAGEHEADAEKTTCFCQPCKLHKELKGKQEAGPHFVCAGCNCKRSTFSQMFSHWPIDLFTALPEAQQTEV